MSEEPKDLACLNTVEKQAETPNFNPKAFTTHSKHKKKVKANYDYSIAKSMLFPIEQMLGLTDLFGGKMVHLSFDCPTNLRTAFNHETKQNGSSSCQELRRFMSNYVATSMVKKNALGNTMSKIVETNFSIGEMVFNQNVQNRPRRLVNRNPDAVVTDDVLDVACQIGNGQCLEPSVETMIYQPSKMVAPKEYRVCVLHLTEFSKISCWRIKR